LELSLTSNYIPNLIIGEQSITTLLIHNIGAEYGEHEVKVIASVANPKFVDSVKMFITSLAEGAGDRDSALNQIEFGKKVFDGNPECLELYELIKQAEESFEKEEYQKAYDLAEGAVQACKDLLALENKEMHLPKKITKIPDIVILVGEVLLFLFIFVMIYRYYQRRRFRKQ